MVHLTDQEQAALFHARGRSRSFRNPAKGLFLHATYAAPTASITNADAFFGDLHDHPITFEWVMQATGASVSGLAFEFGETGETAGVKVALLGDKVGIAAGAEFGDNGANIDNIQLHRLLEIGFPIHCVLAINPGSGKIRFWADGKLEGRVESTFQMTSGWTVEGGSGSIASDQSFTSTQRATPTSDLAPVDFVMSPLKMYFKQNPRQMD